MIEGEIFRYEIFGLCRLVVEAHEDHGVEGVDRRHEEGDAVPIMVALAEGAEFIVSPGILLVSIPGVEKFLAHSARHLG